jgi:hypothetical protein
MALGCRAAVSRAGRPEISEEEGIFPLALGRAPALAPRPIGRSASGSPVISVSSQVSLG